MVVLFAAAAITVNTAFEAGSLGRVERVSDTYLRCAVRGQSDQDGRNRQASWYYFRLDGLPRQTEVRIELVDLLGEYNYRPGSHAVNQNTRPVYSYNNRTWQFFTETQVGWDDQEKKLILRFKPIRSRMWIAHVPPYTTEHLRALEQRLKREHFTKIESAGRTSQGRDIPLWTVTDPSAPDAGKKVLWLMARQHAWEAGTSWVVDGALRYLAGNSPEARRLRKEAIWRFFPMADPDGVVNGQVRFNTYGYDVNRNWDTANEKRTPEIFAMKRKILEWVDSGRRIDLFLTLHNQEMGDYIEGPFQQFRKLAQRFYDALDKTSSFQARGGPRDCFRQTPIDQGRMTVNQNLFAERKIPAFLMELGVQHNVKLNRPRTTADNLEFGRKLLEAMLAAVQEP